MDKSLHMLSHDVTRVAFSTTGWQVMFKNVFLISHTQVSINYITDVPKLFF